MKLWEQESHSLVQSRLLAAFPRVPLQLALTLIKAPADCTECRSILWVFSILFLSVFLLWRQKKNVISLKFLCRHNQGGGAAFHLRNARAKLVLAS